MSGWSREEVEATVSDYLEMLRAELARQSYSKAEHNRRLQLLLRERSRGAIERKHMNITAILHEIGFPSIDGYKPLGNYQSLLREVVVERVEASPELLRLVEMDVDRPARATAVTDLLGALVDPPRQSRSSRPLPGHSRSGQTRAVDYLEREARNRSLGEAGEMFVIRFEEERLVRAGQRRLASQIEHVAITRGPSEGYDIRSFEPSGEERLIEVKTTRYSAETPFFISRNEVAVSEARAKHYQLYRVFRFEESPRLFQLAGSVTESCRLLSNQFVATVA